MKFARFVFGDEINALSPKDRVKIDTLLERDEVQEARNLFYSLSTQFGRPVAVPVDPITTAREQYKKLSQEEKELFTKTLKARTGIGKTYVSSSSQTCDNCGKRTASSTGFCFSCMKAQNEIEAFKLLTDARIIKPEIGDRILRLLHLTPSRIKRHRERLGI